MKAKLEGDRKKRFLVKALEGKRRQLKKEIAAAPNEESLENALRKLRKMPRNSSSTRVKNRCIFSGRARSVYTLFKISRIELRRRAGRGQIPGLRKASW